MNQPLMAVQICIDGSQDGDNGKGSGELVTLFATPNHPLWVETPLAENEEKARMHWLAAECLEPCMVLQLADGRSAEVRSAALIRRTQHEGILFAGDDRVDVAQVLCLSDGLLQVAPDERVEQLGMPELGEGYLAPVHNFEVEEFHTYYVGEGGVWVHNAGCQVDTPGAAIDFAARKAERDAPRTVCFSMGTKVIAESMQWVDIDLLSVGSKVLSRCEKTGKQEFKRITRTYEHMLERPDSPDFEMYDVSYVTPTGDASGVDATPKHPFWVVGEGWVNTEDLKPGQLLEICDPIGEEDWRREPGNKMLDYALSGERWQARITEVKRIPKVRIVYNIEVEDFHTYFVGFHGIWVHNKNQGAYQFRQELKVSNPDARAYAGRTDQHRRQDDPNNIANTNAARGENEAADTLARHDNLEIVQLPDRNTLGKTPRRLIRLGWQMTLIYMLTWLLTQSMEQIKQVLLVVALEGQRPARSTGSMTKGSVPPRSQVIGRRTLRVWRLL